MPRKPWRETVRLPAAPRNLRLVRVLSPEAARQVRLDDQVRAGYERGRVEGEQALSELLVRQRQETRQLAEGVLKSLQDAVPKVIRDSEQMMVALALEIARKLVAGLPMSVEMVEAAVRDALSQVESASEFTVHLHPADLALLQQHASPLLDTTQDARPIRLHASPEVTRGGCVVLTRFGTVDAQRETKFDLLKRSLLP
jgi:flagellar assembly protein FliH